MDWKNLVEVYKLWEGVEDYPSFIQIVDFENWVKIQEIFKRKEDE
jgi:hypothetical protein